MTCRGAAGACPGRPPVGPTQPQVAPFTTLRGTAHHEHRRTLGRTRTGTRPNEAREPLAVIGVLVVAGFTGLTVTGQEKRVATELRTRAFILEDENGKRRARLGMDRDGSPALGLYDANGKERARLLLLPDGSPMLGLHDANERPRAWLTLLKDGPMLGLHDPNGETRAVLRVFDRGPALELSDANGVLFWTTPQIKRTP
jgi:hypothetical protein